MTKENDARKDHVIRLLHGDSFVRIAELEDGSLAAVVTDPPYGINFMNKRWDKPLELMTEPDSDEPSDEEEQITSEEMRTFEKWAQGWLSLCHRKLQPGGVIKVFGATRTFHRMASAMENAGFAGLHLEAWVYASGFPKSLNIRKAIEQLPGVSPEDAKRFEGYGTALKPAWEPFLVGSKP